MIRKSVLPYSKWRQLAATAVARSAGCRSVNIQRSPYVRYSLSRLLNVDAAATFFLKDTACLCVCVWELHFSSRAVKDEAVPMLKHKVMKMYEGVEVKFHNY